MFESGSCRGGSASVRHVLLRQLLPRMARFRWASSSSGPGGGRRRRRWSITAGASSRLQVARGRRDDRRDAAQRERQDRSERVRRSGIESAENRSRIVVTAHRIVVESSSKSLAVKLLGFHIIERLDISSTEIEKPLPTGSKIGASFGKL